MASLLTQQFLTSKPRCQLKGTSSLSAKVRPLSSQKSRNSLVVYAETYKCGNCGNEFQQGRIGRGLSCRSCKNNDQNKFAIANRCTTCMGDKNVDCYECGGAGVIDVKSWVKEGLFPKFVVTGEKECKKCKGTRVLTCATCRGQGKVFYRSADWR